MKRGRRRIEKRAIRLFMWGKYSRFRNVSVIVLETLVLPLHIAPTPVPEISPT